MCVMSLLLHFSTIFRFTPERCQSRLCPPRSVRPQLLTLPVSASHAPAKQAVRPGTNGPCWCIKAFALKAHSTLSELSQSARPARVMFGSDVASTVLHARSRVGCTSVYMCQQHVRLQSLVVVCVNSWALDAGLKAAQA